MNENQIVTESEDLKQMSENSRIHLTSAKNRLKCLSSHLGDIDEPVLSGVHDHITLSIRFTDLAIQKIDKKPRFFDEINDEGPDDVEDIEFKSYEGWNDASPIAKKKILYRELRDIILNLNSSIPVNDAVRQYGGIAEFHMQEAAAWMIESMY